jgi:uncharacterized membrane protein
MHTPMLAAFFVVSRTVVSMCGAGILLFLVALWAAKTDVAQARGLDKIVALSNLCFAIPLAVFGALHLSGVEFVAPLVPSYMPWRLFWAYFVGFALLAASLSNCHKNSGALVRAAVRDHDASFCGDAGHQGRSRPPQRQVCMDVCPPRNVVRGRRLDSCGNALREQGCGPGQSALITVGRVIIAIAAIFYGIEHFLHPAGAPGVPLEKMMPPWIPARLLVRYLRARFFSLPG